MKLTNLLFREIAWPLILIAHMVSRWVLFTPIMWSGKDTK